ncbi:hypothetical protein Tco_1160916 [Tanacetum coccineum]
MTLGTLGPVATDLLSKDRNDVPIKHHNHEKATYDQTKAEPLKEPLSVVKASAFTTHEIGDQNLCAVEESKAEDEANVKDTAYPGKEDGLDSLSFMSWAKAALMTFSEDMLIRRSQSQSLCSDVGEKPKSEKLSKSIAQRFSPPSSGANTVCCTALITRSRGTLLGGLHDDSQSEVFYYAIFISSKTGPGGWSQWSMKMY